VPPIPNKPVDAPHQIVAVAVALPVHETFSYSIPGHLSAQARPGMRVLVPFGRRTVTGYLIGPADAPLAQEIKHILDVLDDTPLFPEALIPFFEWVAGYYMHPLGQVISTALPAGLTLTDIAVLTVTAAGRQKLTSPSLSPLAKSILLILANGPAPLKHVQKEVGQPVSWALIHQMRRQQWIQVDRRIKGGKVRPKTIRVATLKGVADSDARLSRQRRAIRDILTAEGDLSVSELKKRIPTAPALIRAMRKAGQVVLFEKRISRDPFGEPIDPDTPPRLTDEQCNVVRTLTPLLGRGFESILLAGVTGSGKTEVYLRLARATLEKGLRVLVLVPEIALISQTERRFRARFGDIVAVLHSGLTGGERYDQGGASPTGKRPSPSAPDPASSPRSRI